MDKEQEKQFKEHIKKMAREEIQKTFTDNLMETLNSAFIFKYVETLELKCKKQKEVIDKVAEYIIKEKNNYLHHVQKVIGKCIDDKGNINSNTAGLLLSAVVNTCDCTLNILKEVSE